ncbi:HAD family hydrolase [Paenibacillus hodogayensis]|uniref:Phosphoserine phosphatase n=1 Tax=Paenibacillus hodogayensis TaxID=279208 RepID=A0ABV5W4F6_9BACL
MAIQAILFDLDDTLLWDDRSVKEAFQATCAAAAERYEGLDPALLEEAVRREARALYESYETFPFTKQIGINPFEGLWARFSQGEQEEFRKLEKLAPGYRKASWARGLKALGVDDEELGFQLGERFGAERRARPIVYEETFEVLNDLKGKVQLLLLTNGSPDLQREKLDGVPELAGYFDHIVISGSFGQGKPAASIFHHAMELLGISPDQGLMVGDKLTTDILGANGVGMKSVWINRHGVSRSDEIVPATEIVSLRQIRGLAGL